VNVVIQFTFQFHFSAEFSTNIATLPKWEIRHKWINANTSAQLAERLDLCLYLFTHSLQVSREVQPTKPTCLR